MEARKIIATDFRRDSPLARSRVSPGRADRKKVSGALMYNHCDVTEQCHMTAAATAAALWLYEGHIFHPNELNYHTSRAVGLAAGNKRIMTTRESPPVLSKKLHPEYSHESHGHNGGSDGRTRTTAAAESTAAACGSHSETAAAERGADERTDGRWAYLA